MVINTWEFSSATQEGWEVLEKGGSAIDAVVEGCSQCEKEQCDHTVGFGGSPDENGETTLDAMIFDGTNMNMGAVAALRRIKEAIRVARLVLDKTDHSLLVGELATNFAKMLGFKEQPLYSNFSKSVYNKWTSENCQPNFWKDVEPDPKKFCGPYKLTLSNDIYKEFSTELFNSKNHDTIGMIAMDSQGNIAAGTSSNGATHKIPGRVGDSPIVGAGAYADNEAGAAVATGDGDVMMRFVPSFLAVEEIKRGATPLEAAKLAIKRIVKKYPNFMGAVLVANIQGGDRKSVV